jgi:hypothetical protein
MKEIWSKRYGTNPKEGVHKWLEMNIPNYKRGGGDYVFKGFAKFLNPNSNKQDNILLAINNFEKFKQFVLNKNQ